MARAGAPQETYPYVDLAHPPALPATEACRKERQTSFKRVQDGDRPQIRPEIVGFMPLSGETLRPRAHIDMHGVSASGQIINEDMPKEVCILFRLRASY